MVFSAGAKVLIVTGVCRSGPSKEKQQGLRETLWETTLRACRGEWEEGRSCSSPTPPEIPLWHLKRPWWGRCFPAASGEEPLWGRYPHCSPWRTPLGRWIFPEGTQPVDSPCWSRFILKDCKLILTSKV